MPQIKTVAKIDPVEGAKGVYHKVTWDDGKFDNVFKKEFYDILMIALKANAQVEVTKEQNGKYWNIIEVKLVSPKTQETPQDAPQGQTKPVSAQTKGIIPESRNKSFAIAYAKDVMVAKITAGLIKEINKVEVDKCIKLAEEFRAYMDGEPNIVKVAKEHGAVEVEENGNQ
jgi:hypothetical protein